MACSLSLSVADRGIVAKTNATEVFHSTRNMYLLYNRYTRITTIELYIELAANLSVYSFCYSSIMCVCIYIEGICITV